MVRKFHPIHYLPNKNKPKFTPLECSTEHLIHSNTIDK